MLLRSRAPATAADVTTSTPASSAAEVGDHMGDWMSMFLFAVALRQKPRLLGIYSTICDREPNADSLQ